jgi:CheY-like chemotaxis protein
MGYKFAVATNGREAVDTLRRELFDLVLMDIQMPVMDGLSAARAIRNPDSGAKDPDIPIVALTAQAYDEDKQLCFKAGMNDYLLKPVDPAALKAVIDKFLVCDESQLQV